MQLLVVEDDDAAVTTVRSVAESVGITAVVHTALASEAVQLATFGHPDIVVLDLHLMGMSGVDALPALRRAAPEATIIVFTADDGARRDAVAGLADHVADKTDPASLEAALLRALGQEPDPVPARRTTSWRDHDEAGDGSTDAVADVLTRLLGA